MASNLQMTKVDATPATLCRPVSTIPQTIDNGQHNTMGICFTTLQR